MNVDLRYPGRSAVVRRDGGSALRWAPNLARDEVAFEGELLRPLPFREAMAALHDVVVSDLSFRPRGREAYAAWKQARVEAERTVWQRAADATIREELAKLAEAGMPEGLEEDYTRARSRYWNARDKWWRRLLVTDPGLWRKLVPLDPVVTVAEDAVLFECFSQDESSYGCVSVGRDAFAGAGDAALGVTNVDYSDALHRQLQTLRTYRDTRFTIDPGGFGVEVEGQGGVREEKIDLPSSWLRAFGQLQAALTLRSRRLELPREVVYAMLRHLHLRREKHGPRAIRFELSPGRPPVLVLEPWELCIPSRGAPYEGAAAEHIRVWGRRRVALLSRLLPLADRFEVRLLGTGLPSVWVARMGPVAFTLALSGWTRNNWSTGARLDLLAGIEDDDRLRAEVAARLQRGRTVSLDALASGGDRRRVAGALYGLAKRGQVLWDATLDAARWRPILPVPLSEAQLGPEPEEKTAGQALVRQGAVSALTTSVRDRRRHLAATVDGRAVVAVLDADGAFVGATCGCRAFRVGLRGGPCRHLLALVLADSREFVHP